MGVVLAALFGCSETQKPSESPQVEKAPIPADTGLSPEKVALQADIPIYPGATFPNGVTKAPAKDSNGKLHVYLVMTTKDPAEKVLDFYKGKGQMEVTKEAKASQVMGVTPKGNMAIIKVATGASETTIDISSIQN